MHRLLIILMLIISFSLKSFNLSASQKFDSLGFDTGKSTQYDTGVTSLMNAVAATDYKAIEFFIKINPLEIDQQNIGGATALHLAVRNNDQIATKILIDHRANPNIQDIEGYSPAMRACFYGYNDIFKIIQKDSRIDFTLLNNQRDGFIILSALARNNLCLEEVLQNIIPIRDLSVDDLKDRLNRAFIISLAKEDIESKAILLKYLDKLYRFQQNIKQLEAANYRKNQQNQAVYQDNGDLVIPAQNKFGTKTLDATGFGSKKNQNPIIINKSYELTKGNSGLKIESEKPKKKYIIKKPVKQKVHNAPAAVTKYKLKTKQIKEGSLDNVAVEPKKTYISQQPIIEKSKIIQNGDSIEASYDQDQEDDDLMFGESIM